MSPHKRATSEEITLVSGIVVLAGLSRAREGCFQIPTYRNVSRGDKNQSVPCWWFPELARCLPPFLTAVLKRQQRPRWAVQSRCYPPTPDNIWGCKTKPSRVLRAGVQVSEGLLPSARLCLAGFTCEEMAAGIYRVLSALPLLLLFLAVATMTDDWHLFSDLKREAWDWNQIWAFLKKQSFNVRAKHTLSWKCELSSRTYSTWHKGSCSGFHAQMKNLQSNQLHTYVKFSRKTSHRYVWSYTGKSDRQTQNWDKYSQWQNWLDILWTAW